VKKWESESLDSIGQIANLRKGILFIERELNMSTLTKYSKYGLNFKKTQIVIASLLMGISIQTVRANPPQGYVHSFNDNEVLGNHRYTGMNAVRQRTVVEHWRDPANLGAEHLRNNLSEDAPIQGHEGRTVIHAEPIRSPNGLIARDQRRNFADLYTFVENIQPAEQVKLKPMFYRHHGDNHIYSTHTTQQRWRRITDNSLVDFMVVSYKPEDTLEFVDVATNSNGQGLNGRLPAPGLYTLDHLINEPSAPSQWSQRVETWKKLEGDGILPETFFDIRVPSGIMSIPGCGLFSCNAKVDDRIIQDPELARLIKKVNKTRRITDGYLQGPEAQNPGVVIMGPSKSGKTTLLNLLADRLAEARLKEGSFTPDDLEIYIPNALPDFSVGYNTESKTKYPRPLPNLVNGVRLWDTPGIYDTDGGMQQESAKNVAQIIGIRNLFSLNAGLKIGVTIQVSELQAAGRQIFLDLLKKTLDIFPNDAQLGNIFHLIVTQAPQGISLGNYLNSFDRDTRVTSNPRLQSLINLLKAEPDRISYFYKPTVATPNYNAQANLQAIMASIIRTGVSTANLTVNQSLKENANGLIEKYGRQLNEDIVHYLRSDGAQGILDYCKRIGETHQGTPDELRTKYRNLKTRLEGLARATDPDAFVNELHGTQVLGVAGGIEQIFDATDLKTLVNNLKFLKELHHTGVSYRIDNWARGFSDAKPYLNTLGKIEKLGAPPSLLPNGGGLGGIFPSFSEAGQLLPNNQGNAVRFYSLNTMHVDANLTRKDQNAFLFSSHMNGSLANKTLIVSGSDGARGSNGASGTNGAGNVVATAGGDGLPGNPGNNSGSVFMKLFTQHNLNTLQIIANGGQGGSGGNGGQGGNGQNAGNGQEASFQQVSDTGDVCILPWGDHPHQHTNTPYYPHRLYYNVSDRWHHVGGLASWIGEKFTDQIWVHGHVRQYVHAPQGETGKDGGRGGQRGNGGHAGEIIIQGPDVVQKQRNAGGQGASDGAAGQGGQGGTNGMVLKGTKWTNCYITGESTRNPEDRWNDGPRHENPSVPQATGGTTPQNLSGTAPVAATATVPMSQATKDQEVRAFRDYFMEQAKDPLVSPFIKAFPGLK
jgi:hypothetical protein